MNKTTLQSIISKYHLSGLIESVRWEIKDDILTIKFTAPTKEMLGEINTPFPYLQNSMVGIMNTKQLFDMLNITKEEIEIRYNIENQTIKNLIISDGQFTLDYVLADILVISKPGKYTGSDNFEIKTNLTQDNITSIIKAKKSLPDNKIVVFQTTQNIQDDNCNLELIFGGDVEYANKASFNIPNVEIDGNFMEVKYKYDSEIFKEIINSNKDSTVSKLEIGNGGIMKLYFESKEMITSLYYMVPREN